MSRYIDADELQQRLQLEKNKSDDSETWRLGVLFALSHIALTPTADVKPIVKGEWLLNDNFGFKIYDCSNCGVHMESTFNYCPFCGAEMEIENNIAEKEIV